MRENLVMSYLLSFCFFYVNLGLSRSLSRRFIHSVFSSFVCTKQKSFGIFFSKFSRSQGQTVIEGRVYCF